MSTQPTKEESMRSIPMTPQTVALFRKFVEHPEECEGCDYKPIRECFEKSDTCTPQHLLYQQYVDYIKKPLPKVVFYIIMREQFPDYFGKDDRPGQRGDLGYKLKLNV